LKRQIAVILATGKSARMKSDQPNVLERILFEPIIRWVTDACRKAGIEKTCVVTGCNADMVRTVLEDDIETAVWEDQLSAEQDFMCVMDFLRRHEDADVAVLNGDAPFMDPSTLQEALLQHQTAQNAVTLITARVTDPKRHHRVIRDAEGGIVRITGQEETKAANEVCSGGWFDAHALLSLLTRMKKEGRRNAYDLSDMLSFLLQKGEKAGTFLCADPNTVLEADSQRQLFRLNEIARKNKLLSLMDEGVEIPCMDGIIVGRDVKVGTGTILLPGTILRGATEIGEKCTIGPNSLVEDSTVADHSVLNAVQCYHSTVGSHVSVGPFCHIRPNTVVRDGVHIGDFVELKNSDIGKKTHIAHLTYVGDSDVGERVNFGCGVAVANYDGVHKYRCAIGDDAFIGCNTNLVAPVNIGNEGYTAAGSTITEDVPDEAMGIARARQVNKPGYNRLLRRKKNGD